MTLVGKTLEQEETDIGAGSHKILKVMMKAFNIEFAGDVNPELRHLDDPARPYHNAGRRGTFRHFVLRAMITCVKRHAHLHLRLKQHNGAQNLVATNPANGIDDGVLAEVAE